MKKSLRRWPSRHSSRGHGCVLTTSLLRCASGVSMPGCGTVEMMLTMIIKEAFKCCTVLVVNITIGQQEIKHRAMGGGDGGTELGRSDC